VHCEQPAKIKYATSDSQKQAKESQRVASPSTASVKLQLEPNFKVQEFAQLSVA